MQLRTDLAVEVGQVKTEKLKAIFQTVRSYKNIEIVRLKIKNEEDSKFLNKPVGNYVTISSRQMFVPEKSDDVYNVLKDEIEPFVDNKKSILVVGLGNKNICADSVGPQVAEKIFVTRHIKKELLEKLNIFNLPSVCSIAPGVLGQTGIEVSEIVKVLVKKIEPDLIIVVDALAAGNVKRLGTTIQLSDAGIAPGSGVHNRRKELSKKVFDVPVLAIGIPTVVDLQSIYFQQKFTVDEKLWHLQQTMMVTPKNVDEIVEKASKLISGALNGAVFPMFSKQELDVLSC